MRTAVIFERFGEYHHARLAAAAQKQDIFGIEIARQDTTYQWDQASARGGYTVKTLVDHLDEGRQKVIPKLTACLDGIHPDTVAVPGWSPYYSHAAIDWAYKHNARVIVMSDSNHFDARRFMPVEQVKRSILTYASSALVAGQHAADYVDKLGISNSAIALGYNCVDNQHFKKSKPAQINNAPKSFLAVGRMIRRKNFHSLLKAYKAYRTLAEGNAPWRLTILGDGPEKTHLHELTAALGLTDDVSFEGFVQYDQLPSYYHRASAFILPSQTEQWGLVVNEAMAAGLPVIVSNTCGCSKELVEHGKNGFGFDPNDIDALAQHMYALARSPALQESMAINSERIIRDWSPDRFSEGLYSAAQLAIATQRPRPNLFDKAIFNITRKLSH